MIDVFRNLPENCMELRLADVLAMQIRRKSAMAGAVTEKAWKGRR